MTGRTATAVFPFFAFTQGKINVGTGLKIS